LIFWPQGRNFISGICYRHLGQFTARSAKTIKAFAYLRTSSAANIGEDKDSGQRQRTAIETYAKRAGIELVGEFYDEVVKGADAIETRPGFAAMLEAIEGNGTRTIIVETSNRFARDLMVHEVGFAMLKARGIDIIAADSSATFLDDTPTSRLIRQVLGAVSEFEKAMLVAKLKGARDRKRRAGARVEGRKPLAEKRPDVVQLAHKLARARPKGGKLSLREIGAKLAKAGHLNANDAPFAAMQVKRMLAQKLSTLG
jgi:DNA invertase Pin-like site-specific DNA recombinase